MHDLIGKRFGRLTVKEKTKDKSGNSIWKCQCDCGNTCETRATSLQSGHVESCGCIKVEQDKVKMFKNLTYQAVLTFRKKRYYLDRYNDQ